MYTPAPNSLQPNARAQQSPGIPNLIGHIELACLSRPPQSTGRPCAKSNKLDPRSRTGVPYPIPRNPASTTEIEIPRKSHTERKQLTQCISSPPLSPRQHPLKRPKYECRSSNGQHQSTAYGSDKRARCGQCVRPCKAIAQNLRHKTCQRVRIETNMTKTHGSR